MFSKKKTKLETHLCCLLLSHTDVPLQLVEVYLNLEGFHLEIEMICHKRVREPKRIVYIFPSAAHSSVISMYLIQRDVVSPSSNRSPACAVITGD